MSWEDSDRRSRLPENWFTELVPAVKRRDGGRCRWRLPSGKRCPRPGTDVDHVLAGDDHSLGNLQLLCAHHHGKKSAGEGSAARRVKAGSRRRPSEDHPGTVR